MSPGTTVSKRSDGEDTHGLVGMRTTKDDPFVLRRLVATSLVDAGDMASGDRS